MQFKAHLGARDRAYFVPSLPALYLQDTLWKKSVFILGQVCPQDKKNKV